MEQVKIQTKTVHGNEISILSKYGSTQYVCLVSEYNNDPSLRELQLFVDEQRFHWMLIQAKLPPELKSYNASLVSNALFTLECLIKNFPARIVTAKCNFSRAGESDKIHTFVETSFKKNKYVIDCSDGEVKILSAKTHKLINFYGSNDIIEIHTVEELVNALGYPSLKFFKQGIKLKSALVLQTLFEQRMTPIFWKSVKDHKRISECF